MIANMNKNNNIMWGKINSVSLDSDDLLLLISNMLQKGLLEKWVYIEIY